MNSAASAPTPVTDAALPRLCTGDPVAAVDRLIGIHEANAAHLRAEYAAYRSGRLPAAAVEAHYPELVVEVDRVPAIDARLANGYIEFPGRYRSAIARPRMMRRYLLEQLESLRAANGVDFTVGVSDQPIPVEFLSDYDALKSSGPGPEGADERDWFTPIDITTVDDRIADTGFVDEPVAGGAQPDRPLMLFKAQRVDLACSRLQHYTGARAEDIQQFIVFTNYALHTDEFIAYALGHSDERLDRYTELVGPGGVRVELGGESAVAEIRAREGGYQMPGYHLTAPDGNGISIINIGVGPSNAKTITDCLAVLRPMCWIMIGHCAGLDGRMHLGDLLLANAYERKDRVLDDIVPLTTPIPPIPELQRALGRAIEASTQIAESQYKGSVRTGTILSTADRNWEWATSDGIARMLASSTAIGLEMESCTVATNGYRFRVPYAALLSVSDLPLHHVPKMPGSAREFYLRSKRAHLLVAVRACEELAADPSLLYTRKLRRTLGEVPFR